MYCDDNDGNFCRAGTLGWLRGTWVIALRDKWETRSEILKCPAATKRHPSGSDWGGSRYTYIQGQGGVEDRQEECSYGGNNWIYNPRTGRDNIQGRPTAWNWKTKYVKGGYRIPVFADTMWRGGGPYEMGQRGDPPLMPDQWLGYNREMMHFVIDRHDGFVNHLMMDWSVRRVGLKELWTLKWHRQFDTEGPWTTPGGVAPSDWANWGNGWLAQYKDY
jgi:hypothetical protein